VRRIAVDSPKQKEIQQADQTRSRKAQPPSDAQQQQSNDWHANSRGKLGRAIEEARCETPLPWREPVPDSFGVGRKRWSFAHPEQKARGKKAANPRSDCRSKRRQAPEKRADAAHTPHPETIQQEARRQLAQRVGPVVGAQQQAKGKVRNAEFSEEGVVRNREVDAVEIVDQHAHAEQDGDDPSLPVLVLHAPGKLALRVVSRHLRPNTILPRPREPVAQSEAISAGAVRCPFFPPSAQCEKRGASRRNSGISA
jgi:hypothetical protein